MEKHDVVIKARDVFESQEVYQKLNSSEIKSATYALFFALNVNELNPHYAEIEAKRVDLVRRYGEEDDKGVSTVKQENIADFSSEFTKLMDADLSVSLYLFSPDHLNVMFNKSEVTGEEMYAIRYMVDYE